MDEDDKKPLVTIVTPSYNQGRFIEETIKSVLDQDYPEIEHIVMDGGSTDDTLEILKKYGDRLKWFSEKDRGQSDAINKGFSMARGKILAWLNSDDTYLPGAITKAVDFLTARADVMMVYGKGYLIDEDGKVTGECPTEPFNIKRLAMYNYIYQPSAFIRAEVFDTVDMVNVDLKYSMDLDLWIRIAKNFRIEYLPEFLSTYRIHGESKTVSQAADFHREEAETFKRHFGRAPANWVYGYAYYLIQSRFPALKRIKPLFFFFVAVFFLVEYIRINRWSLLGGWRGMYGGVIEKLKKSWDELGRS